MKFDRRSPRAWVVFGLTSVSMGWALLVGVPLRRTRTRGARARVVLYGHTFAGNLRALVDHAPPGELDRWDLRFLYLDPRRYRAHDESRVGRLLALNPLHLLQVVMADVVVTTHGPGLFRPLVGAVRGLAFVDVWHGVGYHRRDAYLRTNRGYARLLLPSEWSAEFCEALGLEAEQVAITGHGIWDSVLTPQDPEMLCDRNDLPRGSVPRVLIAPTWTNKELGEQSPLFGGTWDEALDCLDEWAGRRGVQVVFRSHLNAGEGTSAKRANVLNRPFTRYPLTADVLQLADVLVTDWSSIGTDYLPLRRPVVYLDVPPAFEIGHLGASDRPGAIVGSVEELVAALDVALDDPDGHRRRYLDRIESTMRKACGSCADGAAVCRYWQELGRLVAR